MLLDDLPDQSTLEQQLGGRFRFYGLISPTPPPTLDYYTWAYRRRWHGFDQGVEATNAQDLVAYGTDASVLEALLRLQALQGISPGKKLATSEKELLSVIQEIDPQVNLSSGALLTSLERLMGTGYQVLQFECWSFGFRLVNSLDVRMARVGGKATLREIALELSETTLNLHTSGSLIAWRPEHS
ncbi:hypothetical protein ACFFLM_17545 [Deinococcus oregonensis]|uniref:Uncharacterized protein n=1 Tax=Deinococcus oregonensis TaxID=1805970 RepID=A0ABV6B1Y0_9DEIO